MSNFSSMRVPYAHADPLEIGPPRRVNREETHIGERVAASKKRIAWSFTLGDSDLIHEVVLVHSIMSYKKIVEFDGRQMHFSATATPGDWSFMMILERANYAIEVRINDVETQEVPKYDLVIDRVPWRRWDVYRKPTHRKAPGTFAPPVAPSAYGAPSYAGPGDSGNGIPRAGAGAGVGGVTAGATSFGIHRWGPAGMSGGGSDSQPNTDQLPARQTQGQEQPPHQSSHVQKSSPKPKRVPEMNLLDLSTPEVVVSAPSGPVFDPLAKAASITQGHTQEASPMTTLKSTPPQNDQQQQPPIDPFANRKIAPQAREPPPSRSQFTPPRPLQQLPPMGSIAPTTPIDPFATSTSVLQPRPMTQTPPPPPAPSVPTLQPMGNVVPSQGSANYSISQLLSPREMESRQGKTQSKNHDSLQNLDVFGGGFAK